MTAPQRRALILAGGVALTLVVGCVSSMSQSQAPDGPTSSFSQGVPEPSETEEPSVNQQPHAAMAGTWEGTWLIDGYGTSGGFTMELVQDGNTFSGTVAITNTDCPSGTVEGTINGASVEFGWINSVQPISFEGNLNGSVMAGTWYSQACSNANLSLTGTWEATKQP